MKRALFLTIYREMDIDTVCEMDEKGLVLVKDFLERNLGKRPDA